MATVDNALDGNDRLCSGNKTLPIIQKPSISLLVRNDFLRISKRCRFRIDGDLGIINTGGITNVFVTSGTAKFLMELRKEEFFNSESVISKGINMASNECLYFLSSLENKGVVEIIRKENVV